MNKAVVFSLMLMSSAVGAVEPTPEALDWATSKMTKWVAPGTNNWEKGTETAEEATERFALIARDSFEVAFDEAEPPLFPGKDGRLKTWATLLSVASFESSFRFDVDAGKGKHSKGDHGQSWCLMQVKLGPAVKGKTKGRINLETPYARFTTVESDGVGGEDLVQDRKACFRAGLHLMRTSFSMCKSLPLEDRLAAYASGSCDKGRQSSRWRVGKALRWVSSTKPKLVDETVVQVITEPDQYSMNP